ncbi:hypothetical protein BDV24DRAFT_130072 [Aspergillus arachidicola]|uniref:Secreted protein n=1 Tax=Aspergillus arachidicola TaxID=656916 RepID=A0A5N6YBS4_9EURO|nr:hypothetical protein BDV24DRAFT_130072 [Aspergillus arachidicola]
MILFLFLLFSLFLFFVYSFGRIPRQGHWIDVILVPHPANGMFVSVSTEYTFISPVLCIFSRRTTQKAQIRIIKKHLEELTTHTHSLFFPLFDFFLSLSSSYCHYHCWTEIP